MVCDQILCMSMVAMPILHFTCGSKKLPNRVKQVILGAAVVILAVIGVQKPRENYYDILGIPLFAPRPDVHAAFNKLSQQWHPDKNRAPEAAKIYAKLQEAHKTLMSPSKRKIYSRFGDLGSGSSFNENEDFLFAVGRSITIHVLLACMGFLFMNSRRFQPARLYVGMYCLISIGMELYIRFIDPAFFKNLPFAKKVLPRRLVHEQISMFWTLFPAVLAVMAWLASQTFVDEEAVTNDLMREMLRTNHILNNSMRNFVDQPSVKAILAEGSKHKLTAEEESQLNNELQFHVQKPQPAFNLGAQASKIIGLLVAVNYLYNSSWGKGGGGSDEL